MQVPRTFHRANDIVAPLDDKGGDFPDHIDLFNEPIIRFEKTVVHEVMTFDSRNRLSVIVFGKLHKEFGIENELEGRPFPTGPGRCGPNAGGFVLREELLVIGAHQIAPFGYGNRVDVLLPFVGKEVVGAKLIKPAQFFGSPEKNAAQNQGEDRGGVSFCIGQGECAAPRAAKDNPLLDV